MPIQVMENIIGILPDDAIIIDPFAGVSTTGVAVLNMNIKQNAKRFYVGIEIDTHYYEIGKERLDNTII